MDKQKIAKLLREALLELEDKENIIYPVEPKHCICEDCDDDEEYYCHRCLGS